MNNSNSNSNSILKAASRHSSSDSFAPPYSIFASYTKKKKNSSHSSNPCFSLHLVQGSIVGFDGSVMVNAANQGCLGGGGVDGAITDAGGENLARDRLALPILNDDDDDDDDDDFSPPIRCRTGSAVITGPNDYGSLLTRYVIHAVGPNFWMERDVKLLRSAYQKSLDLANTHKLPSIAFSLLSAGVFRGPYKLEAVLKYSLQSILEWGESKGETSCAIEHVYIFGFTDKECHILLDMARVLLGEPDTLVPLAPNDKDASMEQVSDTDDDLSDGSPKDVSMEEEKVVSNGAGDSPKTAVEDNKSAKGKKVVDETEKKREKQQHAKVDEGRSMVKGVSPRSEGISQVKAAAKNGTPTNEHPTPKGSTTA